MHKPLEQAVSIMANSQRILVIDDDDLLRRTIVRLLSHIHDDVIQAANFQDGEKALRELPPRGLVISDLELCSGLIPEEGLVLARNSFEQRKALRQGFILQTGARDHKIIQLITEALRDGVIDKYMEKPLSAPALFTNVEEILSRSRE